MRSILSGAIVSCHFKGEMMENVAKHMESYTEVLADIFRTYLNIKPPSAPVLDKFTRKPNIILEIMNKMELLPPPDLTIRITGSKGKGSTSRFVANFLASCAEKLKVGLVISPEEIDHFDRMRINNISMSQVEFIECYNELLPVLQEREKLFAPGDYFSPSGIFLLIALLWFKKTAVDYFVLECGRGVKYDEIGNIPSLVSIVTSIFPEHLEYIGPTVEDIALDKLSISNSSSKVILGASAQVWNEKVQVVPAGKLVSIEKFPEMNMGMPSPIWVEECASLASTAVKQIFPSLQYYCIPNSPSFGSLSFENHTLYYEGLISSASLDAEFYAALKAHHPNLMVLISLPDDKDVQGIDSFFKDTLNVGTFHVILKGQRGYLHFAHAQALGRVLGSVPLDNPAALVQILRKAIAREKPDALLLLGTQTFLRVIKQALI